jgi:hypothetical protein
MKYWTRVGGSQRASASVSVAPEPNFVGQGGTDKLIFRLANGRYLIFQPETLEEVRELQSQAAILALNLREPRT